MPEQQIMWTALPRGADADGLYLDVFVSPRLGTEDDVSQFALSDFPEFEHWPTTLTHHLTFAVEMGDDGNRQAAEIIPAALDDAAWHHLFRPSTLVRPWRFKDLSGVPIYSYSIRFVTAYLIDLYRTTGRTHPVDPPTPEDLDELVDILRPILDVRVDEERSPIRREPGDYPTPQPQPPPRAGCSGFLWQLWQRLRALLRRLLSRLLALGLGIPTFSRPRPTPPRRRPPTIDDPVPHPSPYLARDPIGPARLPVLDELERRMNTDRVIPAATSIGQMGDALAARDITFDIARVKRFYDRPESKDADLPRPPIPELDFHQALGALGDYPGLLHTLGLVIKLRIPRPATEPGTVRVIPLWDGQPRASDICPATHIAGPPGFAAACRPNSHLRGGLLDLRGAGDRLATDRPKFDIVQIDTDGAAIKTINLAATLERRRQLVERAELGIDRLDREALASLRSGGLAVVLPDRAAYLHDRLMAAKAVAVPVRLPGSDSDDPSALATGLFAEDLLRGYRVEVSTDGGPWRSLCARIGTYRLVDDEDTVVRVLPQITDEGYVKGTSGTRKAGEENPLYVHEVLVRWTGWSLTAPRPGRTIENHLDDPPRQDEPYDHPALPKSTAVTEFKLVTSFVPRPGSLPRLRFGHSYRIRVLGVDLAGELIAEPDDADPVASDPVTFRRFEPAGPPAALALRPYLPGESLEHIVLRSDGDTTNIEYDERFLDPSETDATAQRTRHLFPPKTSQLMAELHGRFEMSFTGADGTTGNPVAGYRLALRESGTLADPKVIDVHFVDVNAPLPTIEAGDPQSVTPTDPDAGGGYWINRSNTTLPTPYLPDPLVAGVALRGLPGMVDPDTFEARNPTGDPLPPVVPGRPPLLQIPHIGTWPDLKPLRITVSEAPRDEEEEPAPHWSAVERVLTVFLPQAKYATILYSSYIGTEGLDIHGVWDIIDDGDPQLRVQAASGAHWMFSPARRLTLVHAVQHPLPHSDPGRGIEAPAFLPTFEAMRTLLGETRVQLRGTIRLDVASTGRIEVIARWYEWLAHETEGVIQEPREVVAYSSTVQSDQDDYDNFPLGAEPAFQEFGDTRYRKVRYLIRATSRFREYMKPDLLTSELTGDTDPADVIEKDVLNSTRPASLHVLYAMPTFEWMLPRVVNPDIHVYERRGGALRVYLGGLWYLTGEGELLGVVLQTDADHPLPDGFRTRYGADAIWGRRDRKHEVKDLKPEHFRNRIVAATKSGLTMPDLPANLTATVVGFQPEYNPARKLWYADIDIDLTDERWTYWPFVKMAFVRYQPNSLKDAELSKVALSEFGQLAPDRRLELVRVTPTKLTATLIGRAPNLPEPPRVAFRVQSAPDLQVTPDELDWTYVGGDTDDVDASSFYSLVPPSDMDGDGRGPWTRDEPITLPDLPDRDGKRLRLEVAEYELLQSDSEFGKGQIARMTYAAHVDLD